MAADAKIKKIEYQKIFARLIENISPDLAIYCICAVGDFPYFPEIEAKSWRAYEKEAKAVMEENSGFSSGKTDVQDAISKGLSDEDRWLNDWGEGDSLNPYTVKQYRQLDALFKTMTGQLDSLGALSKQQEDTARICAIWALQRAERSAKGDKESIDIAARLDKMIRDNLADCNMRSRDILPTQEQRPDGFVDALRNKYGLTAEMSKDDVLEAFFTWTREHRYPQTVDAEEKALLSIIQTIQKNNDAPVDQELPEEMKLGEFGFEFSTDPNDDEKNAYSYLGLVRD